MGYERIATPIKNEMGWTLNNGRDRIVKVAAPHLVVSRVAQFPHDEVGEFRFNHALANFKVEWVLPRQTSRVRADEHNYAVVPGFDLETTDDYSVAGGV